MLESKLLIAFQNEQKSNQEFQNYSFDLIGFNTSIFTLKSFNNFNELMNWFSQLKNEKFVNGTNFETLITYVALHRNDYAWALLFTDGFSTFGEIDENLFSNEKQTNIMKNIIQQTQNKQKQEQQQKQDKQEQQNKQTFSLTEQIIQSEISLPSYFPLFIFSADSKFNSNFLRRLAVLTSGSFDSINYATSNFNSLVSKIGKAPFSLISVQFDENVIKEGYNQKKKKF